MRAQPVPAIERDGCALLLAEDVTLRPDDIDSGFRWLGAWDVAVPLRPYDELAETAGEPWERAYTKDAILDLRQPLYDPRAVFVKRGSSAEELLAMWDREHTARQKETHGAHPRHCPLCFLRAVWKTKPLLLALPAGWLDGGGA